MLVKAVGTVLHRDPIRKDPGMDKRQTRGKGKELQPYLECSQLACSSPNPEKKKIENDLSSLEQKGESIVKLALSMDFPM